MKNHWLTIRQGLCHVIFKCRFLQILSLYIYEKEMVSYTESDHLKEQVCLGIIDVPIPEHAYVSSWAVYDDMVYYEADYIDCKFSVLSDLG